MVRKPIPPRVALPRHGKSEAEITEEHKARNPISGERFKEIGAKELEILPPKFTEKHLNTKKKHVEEVYLSTK